MVLSDNLYAAYKSSNMHKVSFLMSTPPDFGSRHSSQLPFFSIVSSVHPLSSNIAPHSPVMIIPLLLILFVVVVNEIWCKDKVL